MSTTVIVCFLPLLLSLETNTADNFSLMTLVVHHQSINAAKLSIAVNALTHKEENSLHKNFFRSVCSAGGTEERILGGWCWGGRGWQDGVEQQESLKITVQAAIFGATCLTIALQTRRGDSGQGF